MNRRGIVFILLGNCYFEKKPVENIHVHVYIIHPR